MKFIDNPSLPNWVKSKNTIGIILSSEGDSIMVQKGDRGLCSRAIENFEMIIWKANGEMKYLTSEHGVKTRTEIPFNIKNNKAIIMKSDGTEEDIKKMFFVWTLKDDSKNCNRGIFLEQYVDNKYHSLYWVSDWSITANEAINRAMLNIFKTVTNIPDSIADELSLLESNMCEN